MDRVSEGKASRDEMLDGFSRYHDARGQASPILRAEAVIF